MSIRILVADDHPLIRSAIRSELSREPDLELVGEAETGDEALCFTQKLAPDVLILDISMPGIKAVDIIRQINHLGIATRVLILTSYGDAGIVETVIKAGASGYLLKDEDPSSILQAIRAIVEGRNWFSSTISESIRYMDLKSSEQNDEPLTDREKKIIRLITSGMTNKEIAGSLKLSERTVEHYITLIYRKTKVNSRVEIAQWLKEHEISGF